MVYAQLAAVWLIIIGGAIFIGWRAAVLDKEQSEADAKLGNPRCPVCHQSYAAGEFRGTMPHVCPPGEG